MEESNAPRYLGRPVARAVLLGLAGILAALEEGVWRAPAIYLLPGSVPSLWLTRGLALALGTAAAALAWHRRWSARALSAALGALSAALAISGPAWFVGFRSAELATWLALAAPISIAVVAGVSLASGARVLGSAARSLEVVSYAVHPLRGALALLSLVLGVALAARLGPWRSAAWLGLGVALLGLYLPQVLRFLYGRAPTAFDALTTSPGVILTVASLATAHYCLPGADLGRYPGDVVFASHGPGRYAVSSVQQSFEVYRGRVLRIASVDAKRYGECLVHPALALAPHRERVLVLGTSDGIVEREVLAYPDVAHVVSISDDDALAELALHNAFFDQLSQGALRSPRVTRRVAEPLPWLAHSTDEFDVIIMDLPDPSDFAQGKNYTRFFYETVRSHLSPGGIVVTQATSSAASPASFSTIVATLRSAGFRVHPYAAPIPTLGEWGFVLGSLEPLLHTPSSAVAIRVLGRTSYVDARRIELLLGAPPDYDLDAAFNTLDQQPVVEQLSLERHARGL